MLSPLLIARVTGTIQVQNQAPVVQDFTPASNYRTTGRHSHTNEQLDNYVQRGEIFSFREKVIIQVSPSVPRVCLEGQQSDIEKQNYSLCCWHDEAERRGKRI